MNLLTRIVPPALCLVASIAWAQGPLQNISQEEGERFFETYVRLGDAYDASLVQLYLDNARIHALRRGVPGTPDRQLQLSGKQWKELVQTTMPLSRMRGDRSLYRNLRYELDGPRLRVRADRYALIKCALDRNYTLLMARQPDGSLKIVEEHWEIQAYSSC